jgi:C4-dicarboxylate transporter DctM subunit
MEISPLMLGLICIIILFVLFFLKVPLAYSMAIVGFVGFAILVSPQGAISVLGSVPYRTVAAYVFSVVPFFLLMSALASSAGLCEQAFNASYKWFGHLPGGLAVATVGGCAAFAAVCGDVVASAVTMVNVALNDMRKYGYDDKLSVGCIAAGSTLGILIPPSLIFVIYGILVEESIGRLFIAGILPGILLTAVFMIQIVIMCKRNPKLGPPGPRATWKERFAALPQVWGIVLLFLMVIGGMYSGVFTPTEGGAIGAFLTIIIGLVNRRLTWKNIASGLLETGRTTAMVFALFIGAMILNSFLAVSRMPFELASMIVNLPVPPWGIMAVILIFYIIIGFFMPIGAMVILTVPILHPVVTALGFDTIWFGVMIVLMVQLGAITPPVGLTVFAMAGMIKDVPMFTIFRGAWPFVYSMLIVVIILAIFPEISTFLPSLR